MSGVRLSDGAVGWGEAPPRPTIYGETVSSICSVVRQELAPRLEGEMLDDSTLSKLYARLQTVKNNQAARGALDMALHHALATSRNRTLYVHLGAGSSHVRVSYILGLGEIDDSLAEAERTVAQVCARVESEGRQGLEHGSATTAPPAGAVRGAGSICT